MFIANLRKKVKRIFLDPIRGKKIDAYNDIVSERKLFIVRAAQKYCEKLRYLKFSVASTWNCNVNEERRRRVCLADRNAGKNVSNFCLNKKIFIEKCLHGVSSLRSFFSSPICNFAFRTFASNAIRRDTVRKKYALKCENEYPTFLLSFFWIPSISSCNKILSLFWTI